MSLYPPSPRYRPPRLRGGEALDALSSRFARWCDVVEASKVTAALGSAALELRTIRDAGFLGPPARGGARPRAHRWDVASACWKHWRHFVSLSKARAPLTSSLVERECAVVAFKHWRFGTFGRPVAHDACVVVAWKHWRWMFVSVAKERDAKAERFREALSKRRFLKIKWEDETANRANRRAYDLEARRKRLDRLYGLDPESKYGSAARASAVPRRRGEAGAGATVAATREANANRGFLNGKTQLTRDGVSFSFSEFSEFSDDDDRIRFGRESFASFGDAMTPKAHSRSSRAFSGWRRFVSRSKADVAERARREDAYARSALDDMNDWDEDTALLSRFAEGTEAGTGVSAMAVASAAARRAARRELRLREKRKLEGLAARRFFSPADSRKEEEEAREREERRVRNVAATTIQACFRGFSARTRASSLRGRRDAYALERVRGLRALLDRGQATFAADADAHAAAAREWSESERRLASLRFRNEEAMTRVALARSKLANAETEARTGRARVAGEAESRRVARGEWNALWAPLREWNDPTRVPFPSFPGTKKKQTFRETYR